MLDKVYESIKYIIFIHLKKDISLHECGTQSSKRLSPILFLSLGPVWKGSSKSWSRSRSWWGHVLWLRRLHQSTSKKGCSSFNLVLMELLMEHPVWSQSWSPVKKNLSFRKSQCREDPSTLSLPPTEQDQFKNIINHIINFMPPDLN